MPAKLRCFVAMAFGQKDTDAIFKILRKTLAPLGINAQRVDRIEHNDNGLMLSEKWRSMIIDSGTPSVRMAPFNQAELSAVSRRSRVFPPARRQSQAPRAPMNGSASIHKT